MRYGILLGALLITASACTSNEHADEHEATDSSVQINSGSTTDTLTNAQNTPTNNDTVSASIDTATSATPAGNKRFKEVKVKRLAAHRFRITGKGQIFEASFGWYIEDGHDQLKKGYAMTDAGAPEWGKFDFVIDSVVKKRPNSTLHLVLFETSANDGSMQHELPLLLY